MKNFAQTFLACLLAIVVGSVVFMVFNLILFGAMLAAFSSGGTTAATLADGTILHIELAETVQDHPATDPLEGLDPYSMTVAERLSLLDILGAIERAAGDERIEGIFLDFAAAPLGMATAEEIRAALAEFREGGKFIVGFADYYSQGGYYLASVADKVYLNPEGSLDWRGMASQTLFYKGLLDKLGVEAEIYRVGAFKSAVEPFMTDRMSAENREQLETLLSTIWGGVVADISASRGLDKLALQRWADELAVTDAAAAVELSLADDVLYRDQVLRELNKRLPEAAGDEWDGTEPPFIALADYIGVPTPGQAHKNSSNEVSVIYAEGEIVDGAETTGIVGGAGLAALLADARIDEGVKAVVLRVNSPGGSAMASELIWREMTLLQREKPLVVSMGDYAASGGYWISSPADMILADRATLTGSIGVFGIAPDVSGALESKLGITVDVARTGPSADYMTALRGRTPAERAYIQHSVERIYDTFIDHVSAGRNLAPEQVLPIAGGRVWAGADAVGLGLVDGVGGLRRAIELAADRAGLGSDYRITTPTAEIDPLSRVLGLFIESRVAKAPSRLTDAEAALLGEYRRLVDVLRRGGVQARMPYTLRIE